MRPILVTCIATLVLTFAAAGRAEEPIPAANPDFDPPTLHCIGVRWFVKEADQPEAKVETEYRKKGEAAWHKAMPLRRVETAALQERKPPEGTSLFAGSLFDLAPDTLYEVRLTLVDKNGKRDVRTQELRTWKEPVAPAPARTLHVVPGKGGGSGSAQDPFQGIAAADKAAKPGDLLLLHKGVYDGTATFSKSGTELAPIVWRAAGDGEASIEAPANKPCASASGTRWLFFENLSFKTGRWGLVLHDARNVTVRDCRFLGIGTGITGDRYQERIFVCDSTFVGPRKWPPEKGQEEEHRGIELSGIGHVLCYNRVSGFRDGIDTRSDFPCRGIDIHNNEISECVDDGTELDYSESNCRAYRNRYTNCYMGISFQPSRGGPNYAVRNVLINIQHESFKLHLTPVAPGHMTSGGVVLHNTIVKNGPALRVWSDEGPANFFYARNNLYVTAGASQAFDITCPMNNADFDYDLFAGGPFKTFARWNGARFASIEEFREKAGEEKHGIVVDGTQGIFASNLQPPAAQNERMDPSAADVKLAPGSPAIDKGEPLANANDGFKGAAPDVGAFELGDALPQYGPRKK
jgi:hypothetical protein